MTDLLEFQEGTRRAWMFPRNIRDISPWKIYKILRVLMVYSDVDQFSPEQQPYLYSLLSEVGIKKQDNTRDTNPGGLRTYYAQLEALGLVFSIESDRSFHYTIAGETILAENNPLAVLQCQLLRLQYPSAYGFGQNVKIDSRMSVKPLLFVLKLLHDWRLGGYLTNEDMVFPVIYGHFNSSYEYVVEKILSFRSLRSYEEVITNPYEDLYTPRGNIETALTNMKDIGNTALNYLKAAELVVTDGVQERKTRYVFNENYESIYQKYLLEFDDFKRISSLEEYQSFQRSFGRYNKVKDTRRITTGDEFKPSVQDTFIQTKYIDFINNHTFDSDSAMFAAEMASFGFGQSEVYSAIKKYTQKKRTIEENRYLEYANSGGVYAKEFEKATTNLFVSFGFDKSKWTGTKTPKSGRRGGFADIYIQYSGTNDCGLADTKATSIYSLEHRDMLVMKDTYSQSNKEIDEKSNLKYFIYIAGGFLGNIEKSVSELAKETGICVSAITAENLLAVKELVDLGWSASMIQQIFMHTRVISSSDILRLLHFDG